MNQDSENRRPLKVRSAGAAQTFAKWLSQRDITPNQISVMSVIFSLIAAAFILKIPAPDSYNWVWGLLAAVCIQLRLLCNLFDGMVAIEGGKSTLSGELYNDIPDRISDAVILFAAGATISGPYGPALGAWAGLLAVFTAYIRTLAKSLGTPSFFNGPMAKQHRMAIMTLACLLSGFETSLTEKTYEGWFFVSALMLIVVGSVLTIINRSYKAFMHLENKK